MFVVLWKYKSVQFSEYMMSAVILEDINSGQMFTKSCRYCNIKNVEGLVILVIL